MSGNPAGAAASSSSSRKRPRTSAGGNDAAATGGVDGLQDLMGTADLRAAVTGARALLKTRLSPAHLPAECPVGLEAQAGQIETLLRKALEQGMHEPFLLVGPRGSGKSLCLDFVLRRLRERYAAQGRNRPFRPVYVNGAMESTDVAAIAEIAAQLEMSKSLDTSRKAVGGGRGGRGRSATQQLDFIVEGMRSGTYEQTPLVFVLDHIEAFAAASKGAGGAGAGGGQSKQLLLYSLMDLQHRSDLRFVVLGLSSELDVLDRFEKRIRSRISNKQIFFPPPASRPIEQSIMQVLDQALLLPEGPQEAAVSAAEDDSLAVARRRHAAAFNAEWRRIRPQVEAVLAWPHKLGRPLRWFTTLALRVAAQLDEAHPFLSVAQFKEAAAAQASHLTATAKAAFASLANLELLVVIAMKRLADRGKERCTLDMIWAEYEAFLRQEPLLPCRYSRQVLHKGLLNVLSLGLATACHRVPPGGKAYLEHLPPADKDFTSLDAADVGMAPLCITFYPRDLYDFLAEQEHALPTLLTRWGAGWSE